MSRKIHTRKIGRGQGPVHDGDDVRFPVPRQAKRTSQGPWVCAAAQLKDSTWLEELVSESNTIQAQEGITQAGLSAGNNGVKLYGRFGRFFVRISGLISSFGLALFVVGDMGMVLRLVATGCPGKSIRERLGGPEVPDMMVMMSDFRFRGF